MTNATPHEPPVPLLWDDERIAFRALNTPTERKAQYVISLLKQMRGDYEAIIAAQTQRIQELEAKLRRSYAENMALVDEIDRKDEDDA